MFNFAHSAFIKKVYFFLFLVFSGQNIKQSSPTESEIESTGQQCKKPSENHRGKHKETGKIGI